VASFHFVFCVHDGFPNNKVRTLSDVCAHSTPPPPPFRLLVADADETVTDGFFFSTLFACRLFARALFR
jgi:hypothetical protein